MIVLDEQLLGRNIEQGIKKWYRGKIVYITDLRPDTVIKDEAIPELLQQQNQPTFVTINERDFWRKIEINDSYCVICVAWSDARVREIPQILRSLFGLAEFKTKADRMGKVIRISDNKVSYYSYNDKQLKSITKPLQSF